MTKRATKPKRAKRAAVKPVRIPRVEPVYAYAHVDPRRPEITAGYIDDARGWWRWGVDIPVVIADARHYTVTKKRRAKR